VIALNAYVDYSKSPRTPDERRKLLPNLSQIVQMLQADVGVMFENDGERLTIVDDNGRIIEGADLLMLYSMVFARTHAAATIAVPVTAPSHLEAMLAEYNATVIRTKTDVRSLMAVTTSAEKKKPQVDFAGDCEGGFIFSDFQPAFDSMFAFGKLLEMISLTGDSVGILASALPPVLQAEAVVRCPWEMKGRIMRELTREAEGSGEFDLTDGVKFLRNPSWVLVLPDAADPHFHVYAEGDTEQVAKDLVSEYVAKIEHMRG
jgi:mannose-1-phosphate guanylyltransferase / phosphomannomutase